VDYTPFGPLITKLMRAVAQRHVCRVTHRLGPDDPGVEVRLAPLELIAHSDALYLRGRRVDADGAALPELPDLRLAVHRLSGLRVTTQRFELAPAAEAAQTFGLLGEEPFRVRARFTDWAQVHVRERVWSADQVVETAPDGATVLTFTANSWRETLAWLLCFGPCAEVLDPPRLRQAAARAVTESARRYGQG
jgi:predicted DNA-binding transcriptional regulator YafY